MKHFTKDPSLAPSAIRPSLRGFIKYLVYNIFYPLLLLLSVDKALRYFVKHKRLIITYHGVSLRNQKLINGRHLLSDQFEKHLLYFKKNFNVVSLEAICELKRKNSMPVRHTIALTFDDGFLNNLQTALPLLEKHQLPATFFCCTASFEDERYLHPSDFLNLVAANSEAVKINDKVFEKREYQLVETSNGITADQYINSLSFDDWKTTLLGLLRSHPLEEITKDIDEESYKLMKSENLRQLGTSQVASIGSHCHSHVNIKRLSEVEMQEQFRLSKQMLEKSSKKPVDTIAYPFGYYNRKAVELSKKEGYNYLFAAGDVEEEFKNDLFPRMAVVSAGNYARNILSINKGFTRFGF
jgi:peptidoglycan/xylan/chitin deacetylase (PgdA/CDA1 family)